MPEDNSVSQLTIGKEPPAKPRSFRAYRITELPKNTTKKSLHEALQPLFTSTGEAPQEDVICGLSVAPDHNDPNSYCVATVSLLKPPEALNKCSADSDVKLSLKIDGTACNVQVDSKFTGMTTLYSNEPVVDIVATQGLGSNAFGAWRSQTSADMWLRDFLLDKVKNSRILIYGYNSELTGPGAQSFASIYDLGKGFVNDLKLARSQPNALVEAASNAAVSPAHKNLHESFIGALFFGVPNRGLNAKFLHEIVKGQPNQNLIRSLDPESAELRMLHQGFTTLFDRRKYQFYSYYEMRQTQLSRLNPLTRKPELYDEHAILVLESSATEAVPGQARHNHIPVDGDHRTMTKFSKRTDKYFQQVSADIISLVDIAQIMLEKQSLKTSTNFQSRDGHPIHIVVPYLKNEKYTPRSKLDNILSKTCKEEKAVVLFGLSGTGKTQVVLNLAFQSQHTRSVFWIDGYTVDSSRSSIISIGKALGIVKDGMDENDICQTLKKWLGTDESGNWLAIVENLTHTDNSILNILTGEKGTLLVSTRHDGMARTLRAHQLDCFNMTAEEARTTFHQYSGLDIDDKTIDESDIITLIKLLDYSPLAIGMAASFIHETKTLITEYIETCQRSLPDHVKLWQSPFLRSDLKDFPTPAIMAAWDISFCRVKRDSPSAVNLLQLMSMLDSHNIPMDLLYSEVTKEMGLEKGRKFEAAIGVLLSFSFLTVCKESRYHIHDLVAIWTRKHLGDREEYFAKCSLSLIEEVFSKPKSPSLIHYLPHAKAVLLHSEKVLKLAQQRSTFQFKLADILYQSGRNFEARELIKDCVEYYEAANNGGIKLAECTYQLAIIEEANKDYSKALLWCEKARDGFATNLGQTHPRSLSALTRMAKLSEIRGDYTNAIHRYEQALTWSKATTADSFTIDTIHNMALVFDKQGRYGIAVDAYTQALQYSIHTVGEQHPFTLDIQNNLAITLRKQGRYDEALKTLKSAFNAYSKIFGKDDLSTLNVLGNIALIEDIQGQHSTALQTYKRVLDLKEKSLGNGSLSTLSTQSNMALLLSKLGRHDEALTVAQRALEGFQTALGDDNPATFDAVANCALVYDSMGDASRAKEHYEHACWRKAMVLGPEHPSTLRTLAGFATLLVRLGIYDEALVLQTTILSGYAAAFGSQHPFAVKAEYELAKTLEQLQRWEEARKSLARVIQSLDGRDPQMVILAVVQQDLQNVEDKISGKMPAGLGKFGVVKQGGGQKVIEKLDQGQGLSG